MQTTRPTMTWGDVSVFVSRKSLLHTTWSNSHGDPIIQWYHSFLRVVRNKTTLARCLSSGCRYSDMSVPVHRIHRSCLKVPVLPRVLDYTHGVDPDVLQVQLLRYEHCILEGFWQVREHDAPSFLTFTNVFQGRLVGNVSAPTVAQGCVAIRYTACDVQ